MNPIAILAGDLHLREDTPLCRTDNYQKAQVVKTEHFRDVCDSYVAPLILAGDVFDYWNPTHEIVSLAMNTIKKNSHIIPGNHDLPYKSIKLFDRCGLSVLKTAGYNVYTEPKRIICRGMTIDVLPWGHDINILNRIKEESRGINILVAHFMTWCKREPWPGIDVPDAIRVLKNISRYDIVLVGHNHKTFVVRDGNRTLISPGSLMRMDADQADHEPAYFLLYPDLTVKQKHYLFEKGVVSREHIEVKNDKENRLQAFVARLKHDMEVGISFKRNMEQFLEDNKVHPNVKKIIWESMDWRKS
jgi:DNA repair exonuclease SbcCD nuclease subunit